MCAKVAGDTLVTKITKYTNFDELKSNTNVNQSADFLDAEELKELEEFVELLRDKRVSKKLIAEEYLSVENSFL